MRLLALLLLLYGYTDVGCVELSLVKDQEFGLEGNTVSLSYKHSKLATNDFLFWYRHRPGSAPQLLVSHSSSGVEFSDPVPGLKIKVELNFFHLVFSSAAVTDSAVYYCAAKPTVVEKPQSLYKNLCRVQRLYLQNSAIKWMSARHAAKHPDSDLQFISESPGRQVPPPERPE